MSRKWKYAANTQILRTIFTSICTELVLFATNILRWEDFKEGTHRVKPTAVPSVNLTTSTEDGGASTCGNRISLIETEPTTPTKVTITPAFVTPPKEACVVWEQTTLQSNYCKSETDLYHGSLV